MLLTTNGRAILAGKPRISSASLNMYYLSNLPSSTFGYKHFSFFERNGISPDSRSPVLFMPSGEMAYIMQRYRECHDFLHTLCGLGVSVEEELALKLFEFIQTRLPMTFLSFLGGPLALTSNRRKILRQIHFPWAISAGLHAKFYLDFPFESYLEHDIEDVRQILQIKPCNPR